MLSLVRLRRGCRVHAAGAAPAA